MDTIKLVKEFMAMGGQHMPASPEMPTQELAAFRYSLNKEENREILDATLLSDFVAILDGVCDLRYVADGQMISFGISKELFDDAFAEVHRANMSKFCETEDEAQRTVDKYAKEDVATYYGPLAGYFVVYRASDKKVLKSCNWTEPDLISVLKKHGIV